MIKRWFLPDVVVAVFFSIIAILILDIITSEQSGVLLVAGVMWTFCGIALTAYCGKNWRKVIRQAGYVPFAFGVSSIFFGPAIALAPTDLLRDIIALAFLAIVCMSVIVVLTWLRKLLTRKVWT